LYVPSDNVLTGEEPIYQGETGNSDDNGRDCSHRPSPNWKTTSLQLRPPHRLHFSNTRLFHGVPTRDTCVHVIFEQQLASLWQVLA
jgi:hypothetical protein